MAFIVPPNQTVSRTVYGMAVANESRLSHEFLTMNASRIDRAFDAGEPVWMIVGELNLVHSLGPVRSPHKTPRQLAARVVRAA